MGASPPTMTAESAPSAVFHRRLDRPMPTAVRGEGCWIEDAEGRRYLDASGGALVANLGHGDLEAADAVAEAVRDLGYVNGTQFTHRWVEQLAAELAPRLPMPRARLYFLSSGSEAVEASVKLARQIWVERGRPRKWKVVHRVPSYHGNTLAALALSGREPYRKLYGPLLLDFPGVAAPDPYRDPEGSGATGEALERALEAAGPESVAAFVYEPIGGSASGAVVPSAAHYARVAEICRRHEVLLIADEILCGMGRTGRWTAGEHFDLVPDLMVLGKGLNGGFAPLSAVVARGELVDELARGSGAFLHAQTYSHTPTICAAGLATVRRLGRERLVERVAALEPGFFGALAPVAAHSLVGDLRGRGFLAAVELVADRATKRPFPPAARAAERLAAAAFAEELIVWPSAGHVGGTAGDLVLLGPPFVATEAELAEIGGRLVRALDRVADGLRREAVEA